MIAGLAEPTAGEVRVFGASPREAGAARRIGVLVETPGLYGSMSAYDNLMLKALALGLVDPKEKARELLEFTGLGQMGGKKTKHFSMGMKQRLGLALALLGDPDLLLLDEPLNGLDPEGAREIRQLVMQLNDQRGITVVVSSHVLEQLGKMATRYGVIREGRMVRELSAAEVETGMQRLPAGGGRESTAGARRAAGALPRPALPGACPTAPCACSVAPMRGRWAPRSTRQGIAVSGLYAHKRDLEEFFVEMMGAEYRG